LATEVLNVSVFKQWGILGCSSDNPGEESFRRGYADGNHFVLAGDRSDGSIIPAESV
jgi:hypothetical protein